MGWTVVIAIAATALALVHLLFVPIPERGVAHVQGDAPKGFGFREVIPAVLVVPGLLALILFSTFNNLVGGVFMALMDPYGLTLFSVEVWGIVLRSEEHTSELQSLMRISYAVFSLTKKHTTKTTVKDYMKQR